MLAILYVALPFTLIVPEGAEYRLRTYSTEGVDFTIDVPQRSDRPPPFGAPEHVEVDGKSAFYADTLSIKFHKAEFNRTANSESDPPFRVLNEVLDFFLSRLKYVARAPQVHTVALPECAWRIRYLNDDGTELPEEAGKVRGRGALTFSLTYLTCNPALWDKVNDLPTTFTPPSWHTLLVDSRGALPHVGSAVVLAAAALEVFIADVIGQLHKRSSIPETLWTWINDRGDWQKEPSVEEQFSILLSVLCAHSLKEDNALWEAFKNLRAARNSFVHEGVPRIGKQRTQVTPAVALQLIVKADEIVARIREWLPADLRWPVFTHDVPVKFIKRLSGPTHEDPSGARTAAPPGDA